MKKQGFTLIELIFVIVILAVISMFGTDLYTKVYTSYAHARAINVLETRTQNALSLISSKLEDRIKQTLIGRRQADAEGNIDDTFVGIGSVQTTHDVLEWIGQSVESKNLITSLNSDARIPGWSGFIDLNFNGKAQLATATQSSRGILLTQGSDINSATNIINNLTGQRTFGLIFKDAIVRNIQNAYGYAGNDRNNRLNVAIATEVNNQKEQIAVTDYPGTGSGAGFQSEISAQYYLAHTAYAIVPVNVRNYLANGQTFQEFDLVLRYNYRPWNGQSYRNASSALIAQHVTLFRFKDDNGAVALKLCMRDAGDNINPDNLDLIICKSQVVF